MTRHTPMLAAGTLAVLLSTSALAAGDATISGAMNLPDKQPITLTGTVDKIENEREFTLRDQTGTINIDIESNQSVVLKPGQEVTVFGEVDKDILGTDVNASKVSVNKSVGEVIGDTVRNLTNSAGDATAVMINQLPDQGMVRLTGTVSDMDSEKQFTLKDATGSVQVDIESAQAAALTEGAEVNVTGYVDKGLFGKEVNATEVQVVADTPMATKTPPRE